MQFVFLHTHNQNRFQFATTVFFGGFAYRKPACNRIMFSFVQHFLHLHFMISSKSFCSWKSLWIEILLLMANATRNTVQYVTCHHRHIDGSRVGGLIWEIENIYLVFSLCFKSCEWADIDIYEVARWRWDAMRCDVIKQIFKWNCKSHANIYI